ncbi:hypothetical protein AB0K43_01200 [Kitasatospora sp. NPDC049258]|uniref:hypothetical protein n=1 Tax=Kitasatospora sp. NPDC049258 TaxID=3155394 RepID=UPI00344AF094
MILGAASTTTPGTPIEGYLAVLLMGLATLGFGVAVRFDLRGVGSRIAATHRQQAEHRRLYGQEPTLLSQLFCHPRLYGALLLAGGVVMLGMDAFLFAVRD